MVSLINGITIFSQIGKNTNVLGGNESISTSLVCLLGIRQKFVVCEVWACWTVHLVHNVVLIYVWAMEEVSSWHCNYRIDRLFERRMPARGYNISSDIEDEAFIHALSGQRSRCALHSSVILCRGLWMVELALYYGRAVIRWFHVRRGGGRRTRTEDCYWWTNIRHTRARAEGTRSDLVTWIDSLSQWRGGAREKVTSNRNVDVPRAFVA